MENRQRRTLKRARNMVAIFSTLAVCAGAADWPQYRGPNGDSTSAETGLARSWPEGGPEVLWTLPLGPGFGGPAVGDGKVYVLDRIAGKQDVLRCVGLASGKEEWRYAYDASGKLSHPGSRTVPAVDSDFVFTCGGFGDLYCFDKSTRKPVWNKNIWTDFGGERLPMWGIAQNPLLYGDVVIVAAQTPKAGIVAFDKKTGEVRWQSPPIPGSAGYVTPTLATIAGVDQIVMVPAGERVGPPPGMGSRGGRGGPGRRPSGDRPGGPGGGDRMAPRGDRPGGQSRGGPGGQMRSAPSGKSRGGHPGGFRSMGGERPKGSVVGIDAKTGKQLWAYDGWQCQTPCPAVTAIGDGRVFITGGYSAGAAMIEIEKKDGKHSVTELFKTQAFGTHVHPALLYKEHLYGHCTTNFGRRDGLVCMDLDGNVKWKTERSPAFDKGGFIIADGLLLSVDGKEGDLYLIEPSPDGYKQLGQARLLESGEVWAPLALVDGKLLIRDQRQMKCVSVR